jgi:hypothetical protein
MGISLILLIYLLMIVLFKESVQMAKEDAESSWRRLALQFDEHRMQAIGHLKCMVQDPQAHKAEAEKFLAAGPLSGEKVLAQRLQAIVNTTMATKVGLPIKSVS